MTYEQLHQLGGEVDLAMCSKQNTIYEDKKNKFLSSKEATKLAEKIEKLKKDYSSVPQVTKVKFEVELAIYLEQIAMPSDLFTAPTDDAADLFDMSCDGKIVPNKSLSTQAKTELQYQLDTILEGACMDALMVNEPLSKSVDDIVRAHKDIAQKLNANDVEACDLAPPKKKKVKK